jgi:hypothetical protein
MLLSTEQHNFLQGWLVFESLSHPITCGKDNPTTTYQNKDDHATSTTHHRCLYGLIGGGDVQSLADAQGVTQTSSNAQPMWQDIRIECCLLCLPQWISTWSHDMHLICMWHTVTAVLQAWATTMEMRWKGAWQGIEHDCPSRWCVQPSFV